MFVMALHIKKKKSHQKNKNLILTLRKQENKPREWEKVVSKGKEKECC